MVDRASQHGPRPLPLLLDIFRRELTATPDRLDAAMRGLRTYQAAPRIAAGTPLTIRATVGPARLMGHPAGHGPVVVLVPSLVNGPEILALAPGLSLLDAMADAGFDPLLVHWGAAGDRATLSLDGHVTELLVPMLGTIGDPVRLVGYCLGGTLALAAARLTPVRRLALLATPWHFSAYSVAQRTALAELWARQRATCASIGGAPMELLQTAFWSLDPAGVAAKYAHLGDVCGRVDAVARFVAVEDWANGGALLPLPAADQLIDAFFGRDDPGCGRWRCGTIVIGATSLGCPALAVAATGDRIVPAGASPAVGEAVVVPLGHVGMIVSRQAPDRLWRPLIDWLKAEG